MVKFYYIYLQILLIHILILHDKTFATAVAKTQFAIALIKLIFKKILILCHHLMYLKNSESAARKARALKDE